MVQHCIRVILRLKRLSSYTPFWLELISTFSSFEVTAFISNLVVLTIPSTTSLPTASVLAVSFSPHEDCLFPFGKGLLCHSILAPECCHSRTCCQVTVNGMTGLLIKHLSARLRVVQALLPWCTCAGEELRCGMLHGMTRKALLHAFLLRTLANTL